jgi:hypothetical protein
MYPYYALALDRLRTAGPSTVVPLVTGRRHLSQAAPFCSPVPLFQAASRLEWRRVAGTRHAGPQPPPTLPSEVLSGLATLGLPFGFSLLFDGEEVCVAVGAPEASAEHAVRMCRQAVEAPMDHPRHDGVPRLTGLPNNAHHQVHWGCLAGTPGMDGPPAPRHVCDVLLDNFRGSPFCYVVYCTPEPEGALADELPLLRHLAQTIERTCLQLGSQANIDREALLATRLLDGMVERLERGLAGGLWRVSAMLGTGDTSRLRHGLALLAGHLAAREERSPTPLRGFRCATGPQGISPHGSLLTGPELSSLCILPGRDRLGYEVSPAVGFQVDLPGEEGGVSLASVVDRGTVTGRALEVPLARLCRHTLVVGHPGAGKTTTVHALLREASRGGTPFLVIEPAKGEYASLADSVAGLQLFRVGSPPAAGEAPFRFNPFHFPAGFPLHTHIDFLKQCFIASFGLVPPTPYLLESAIYRVYARHGWDLVDGTHPAGWGGATFPSLNDLVEEIDPVVEDAGYDRELSLNLRAALRTRLGNLCIGPKGCALDTRENTPDEVLFGSPTVVELRHLGADQEKALVMGLLLTRLYELRETSSRNGGDEQLRHLLVIEEAHRLLRHTRERAMDEGNMAHHAVESFCNLLAEVRAYGQGVVIVDQLPTKLTPDAVKLCGMKLVHRLTPKDDRDMVGDAMVLSERQKREMATLATGECLVHSEGMGGAARVRVHAAGNALTAGTGREVR